MKKTMKICIRSLCLLLCLCSLCACADSLDKAPAGTAKRYDSGDAVELSEEYFDLESTYSVAKKKDGYVPSLELNVDVQGYDADFTYFDVVLTVFWSYTVITDTYRTGKEMECVMTLELSPNGDGSCREKILFEDCRGIFDVTVCYEWEGAATRL